MRSVEPERGNAPVPEVDPENIVVLREHGNEWQPAIGEEVLALLEHLGLPESTVQTVRDEGISVLSRCVSPLLSSGQRTGLVLGYVQSGKTMSFTTVAAAARDNGFAMVIVIAGASILLTTQSRERLRSDLRIESRDDRNWRHFHNPHVSQQDHERIQTTLEDWRDEQVPQHERTTVLITVMKNHRHLNNLTDVLRRVTLARLPVLIVDDEADQAGLNNLVSAGEESTTYQRLCALKDAIPHHTFLQYTATPQGPLLINLIDVLSPDFAVPLTPGPGYTGGKNFFLGSHPLLRVIPPEEIPSTANELDGPPPSLLEAMRIFFLGAASGAIRDQQRGNRAMMVHPSQRTNPHNQYFRWVRAVQDSWRAILSAPSDPDYEEVLQTFHRSYDDLAVTVPNLESFGELVARLPRLIRRTEVTEVNTRRSGHTPEIDWLGAYSHILVGGQALDRGFTVEGLTVTYMPRGVGARRADTIQQRARFFGYKGTYLGFCRVFAEQQVADAFERYVRHEEDIRAQLVEVAEKGVPLDDLRRTFLLPRGLRATRDSIIDVDYVLARLNGGWFHARAPHDAHQEGSDNRVVANDFLDSLTLMNGEGHPDRTDVQRHRVAYGVPLIETYENLLLGVKFSRLTDAQNLLGTLVILRGHLRENPDAVCDVYEISPLHRRTRSLNHRDEISNLFQGAYPVNPVEQRGSIYPGDRELHSADRVTIQIHRLDIQNAQTRAVVHSDVVDLAIWIPSELDGDVLIQDQGATEEMVDD